MPRTLLLTYDFPPIGGGVARAMGELARHAAPGSMIVSTGRQPGSGDFDATCGSRVDRLTVPSERLRQLFGLVRWARRAAALAAECGIEFSWAGNLKPAGHVARWLDRRRGLPFGLIVYGLDLHRLQAQATRSAVKRRVARDLLSAAAGTAAISHWTAARFAETARLVGAPESTERLRVIPLGVDSGRFRPPPSDRAGRRGRQWLLTVARLVPHKGVDVALQAVAALVRQGRDVGYLVAGEGPALGDLQRMAHELGLGDRVRWLGRVTESRLPDLYRDADLYLGLSREEGPQAEGFGLALLEAQAAGLPVLAGRSGGTADAVADGTTGFLVAPRDVPAVVELAGSLLADPARAMAIGAAGRARVIRTFSWQRVLADLDQAATAFSAAARARAGR